ncbi:hypothetical protein Btru_038165, partial [Bulinus truncatus]
MYQPGVYIMELCRAFSRHLVVISIGLCVIINAIDHGTNLIWAQSPFVKVNTVSRLVAIQGEPKNWITNRKPVVTYISAPHISWEFKALGFLWSDQLIFWSESTNKKIQSLVLNGTTDSDVIFTGTSSEVHGLTVDWMSRNLYFTDALYNWIMLASIDKNKHYYKILVQDKLDSPHGIAVHPMKGSMDGLLSYEAREMAIFILVSIVQPPFLITGVLTNAISIVTFLKLGIHQSITACFFLLSCSDLAGLMFAIPATSLTNVETVVIRRRLVLDGKAVAVNLIGYYFIFFDTSQLITAFIAVQRSCCVALPFTFKDTFTRRRAMVVVALIFIYCMSTYLPVILSQGLVFVFDEANNLTVLTFWGSPHRQSYVSLADNLSGIGLTTLCQVTIIICLVIMAVHFKSSSNFRKSMAGWTGHAIGVSPTHTDAPGSNSYEQLAKTNFGTRREIQALQIATFVSIIFVMCNTPKVILAYSFLAVPDLSLFHRFENIYYVVNILRNTVEYINTSLNMFVYIRFNTNVLVWSDWGERPRIERSGLLGQNRVILVDRDILQPRGLAVDYKTDTVYWVDPAKGSVEAVQIDGTRRKVFHSDEGTFFYGVALYDDYLFVTEKNRGSLKVFNKQKSLVSFTLGNSPYDIIMYDSSQQPGNSNPCLSLRCEQICVFDPVRGPTCVCGDGYVADGETSAVCKPTKAFVHPSHIYAIRDAICQYPANLADMSLTNITLDSQCFLEDKQ